GEASSAPALVDRVSALPSDTPPSLGQEAAAQTGECQGDDPDIRVKNVSTGPSYPDQGETGSTSITPENLGQASGTHEEGLYPDRDVRTRRTVTVPAGGLARPAFESTFEEPGNHTVGIRWSDDYPTVADIAVGTGAGADTTPTPSSALPTEPSTLDFGETAVADATAETVTVTNEGNDPLRGGRAVVDRREATIPEGGKRAMNFERSFDQPGTYEIQVTDVFVGTVHIAATGDGGRVDVGTDDGRTTTEAGDQGDDGGVPLAPILLIGGAIALLVAYMRYSGRPPGTGPREPPEYSQERTPAGAEVDRQPARNAERADVGDESGVQEAVQRQRE
ncbi:MAG: hypothetical protein V5A43_11120, partial [Haloarculaceae archaeon]